MKKNDELKSLRSMSAADLSANVRRCEEELMRLRFSHASRQLSNPSALKRARLSLARANTVLKELGS